MTPPGTQHAEVLFDCNFVKRSEMQVNDAVSSKAINGRVLTSFCFIHHVNFAASRVKNFLSRRIVPSGFNDSRTGKPTTTPRTSMFKISVHVPTGQA